MGYSELGSGKISSTLIFLYQIMEAPEPLTPPPTIKVLAKAVASQRHQSVARPQQKRWVLGPEPDIRKMMLILSPKLLVLVSLTMVDLLIFERVHFVSKCVHTFLFPLDRSKRGYSGYAL